MIAIMDSAAPVSRKGAGCLGILVVLSMIALARSFTGHVDATPTTASTSSRGGLTSTQPTTKAPVTSEVAIGRPARDADAVFTVTKVRGSDGITFGGRRQTPQGVWVGAWVDVANTGEAPMFVSSGAQELFDVSGRRYETDPMAELYFGWDAKYDGSAPINPGNRAQLLFIWDVPMDAALDHMILHAGAGTKGASIRVKLKFGGNKQPTAATPSADGEGTADCGETAGYSVSVNSRASCEFAGNVAAAYAASHASTISAFSPVTGTQFALRCTGAGPVICVGGKGAQITLR